MLILVRHGHYSSEMWDPLDEMGKNQIRSICQKLSPYLKNLSLLIFTSRARRAAESALIIAQNFGASFEIWDSFVGWNETPEGFYLLGKYSSKFDNLMFVGHEEFLTAFLSQYLKIRALREIEFPMGSAWVIDQERSFFLVMPE